MSRMPAAVLALVLCAAPHAANGAPSDFDCVVHAVESQTGVRRLPMFGLGFLFRASAWLTEPAGASGMEVAVFNSASADSRHDFHGFSIATFEDVIARTLDKSWHLTLQTSSNADQSHALISMAGNRSKRFLTSTSFGAIRGVRLS